MIDYEILKAIWWLFIGVLLVGFTIMDGQDMGVGTLLPFLGKNDSERRIMINSVAPHWDGNQVWFVTGGGAMFAAWPLMYAIAFSGFYWAMLVILAALMFRPLAFDYRSKVPAERWRSSCGRPCTVRTANCLLAERSRVNASAAGVRSFSTTAAGTASISMETP